MRTVHKCPLRVGGFFEVLMPEDAKIVMFADQGGDLMVWYETDTALIPSEMKRRSVCVVGTGHLIHPGYVHVASCQQGPFVWHLYQR